MYRICWRNKRTGEEGHGDYVHSTKELALERLRYYSNPIIKPIHHDPLMEYWAESQEQTPCTDYIGDTNPQAEKATGNNSSQLRRRPWHQ